MLISSSVALETSQIGLFVAGLNVVNVPFNIGY
jgi:hypothetical protein